ncbi:ROK family protein [Raineyella sp. LH-20]|uniref:ROK family protein n=1 Tax=Raineyella sp. LH-20 TaxID=3081204 RepID=UPI0029542973|nr:ROK family protein [Raineyella sp. LH-20]WOP19767.1 ROK family protein [Raineyella sp. LH-20]
MVGGEAVYGGVEAGGTKFVCCLGTGPDDIRAEVRFPTTTPEETLGRVVAFFREAAGRGAASAFREAGGSGAASAAAAEGARPAAVGVACFGPVDLDPASATYGHITTTPKPGWAGTDVAGVLRAALGVPVGFDTDVNGAALGEARWGAGQGMDPFVYVTVGTGIGGGAIVNGAPLHGLVHPEMGHVRVRHDRGLDPFPGGCPFHDDCLEGLASGPAMERRWGAPAQTLPAGHPAWELEASYLAELAAGLVCTLSPRRIVFGGGVMAGPGLFPMMRQRTRELLAGYVSSPAVTDRIDDYLVPPGLGERSGRLGALALAEAALAAG